MFKKHFCNIMFDISKVEFFIFFRISVDDIFEIVMLGDSIQLSPADLFFVEVDELVGD